MTASFDATRGHVGDNRHRMVLHNAFGLLLAEQVFGPALVNSDDCRVFVRDIAAQHILEDLGFIPSLEQCLSELPIRPWMAGARKASPRSDPESDSDSEKEAHERPLRETG